MGKKKEEDDPTPPEKRPPSKSHVEGIKAAVERGRAYLKEQGYTDQQIKDLES